MKNPFTHTPGRVGDANIETDKELEIYNNFEYDVPSEAVYKIVGIRGSGKTVILGNILRHYRNEEMKKLGWLVYDLSSARNLIKTLISYLSLEPEVRAKLLTEKASVSLNTPIISASLNLNNDYSDEEVQLEQLLSILVKSGKKILIGIDDVAKTEEMTQFCSVFAKFLRYEISEEDPRPWPVYLICTGIYKNLFELGEAPNLTFFKRAAEIKTEPFSIPAMSLKYEITLDVNEEEAIKLARMTKGFAYAYQVLGSAYFANRSSNLDYILKVAKGDLFSHCYEKIWSELPEGEREILRIVSSGAKKRQNVLLEMKNKNSYQVNSNSLKKQGLLEDSAAAYGVADITLPFFGEYIEKYAME